MQLFGVLVSLRVKIFFSIFFLPFFETHLLKEPLRSTSHKTFLVVGGFLISRKANLSKYVVHLWHLMQLILIHFWSSFSFTHCFSYYFDPICNIWMYMVEGAIWYFLCLFLSNSHLFTSFYFRCCHHHIPWPGIKLFKQT